MGVVYEGVHRTLGRRAAIKVMHPHGATRELHVKRFMREGRAAAHARHPHVVDVLDFGVHEGTPYLVMELVEGETLAQMLRWLGPLSPATIAELLLPVVSAVAALHAAGVVHRDLKPGNILLARERSGGVCPKVADFGVSRFDDGSPDVTDSNAVLGTYAYMAPEVCRAGRNASPRSDVYALGAIVYECAVGAVPFSAPTLYDLLHAIMNDDPVTPSVRRSGLPQALDALVMRALRRDPAERFACAKDLGDALLDLAEPRVAARWDAELRSPESTVSSVRPLALAHPEATSLRGGRARRVAWLAGAALLGVTAASWAVLGRETYVSNAAARVAGAPPAEAAVVGSSATSDAPAPAPPVAPLDPPAWPSVSSSASSASYTAPASPAAPSPPSTARARSGATRVIHHRAATPPPVLTGDNGAPILDPP
jgi:tRNA A-37 threonylcarbamoyl transferase component Bud32